MNPLMRFAFAVVLAVQAPSVTPIADRAIATLKIPGYADFLAPDGRDVWTTNEGRVEKLRLDSRGVVATVAIPEPCGAMVVAFESLWVASCRDSSVYRIDRSSATVVASIRTGLADPSGELSLAAGAGSVWVLSDSKGVLSRIDPATNRVTARIPVQPHSFAAAFAFGAVWITTTGPKGATAGGSVQRIDPSKNAVAATIPVGPVPRFLAAGEGAVWTLNQGDGTVTRIDPVSNRAVAAIETGMKGGGGDIATGQGRVWVRGSRILLATIDPETNRVAEVFGPPAGSGAVRVAEDLVWVTAHDARTVWVLGATSPDRAQVVNVWPGVAPGSESWTHTERVIENTPLGTVILDVVTPTLTAYLPERSKATGTGVIIAPGGVFVALAIDLEGADVARWLQERGIAAFVLKYRLVHKLQDGIPQMDMDTAGRYGIADGIQAIRLVRQRAEGWGLAANRIGVLGFSAGAMVASGTLLQADSAARPAFAAMMYGGPFGVMPAIPSSLPPMFLAWAQDDAVALRPVVRFHDALQSAGYKPEVHVFNAGGHGFGMRKQGTSSDHWIDAFYYWLEAQGLTKTARDGGLH